MQSTGLCIWFVLFLLCFFRVVYKEIGGRNFHTKKTYNISSFIVIACIGICTVCMICSQLQSISVQCFKVRFCLTMILSYIYRKSRISLRSILAEWFFTNVSCTIVILVFFFVWQIFQFQSQCETFFKRFVSFTRYMCILCMECIEIEQIECKMLNECVCVNRRVLFALYKR